MLEKFRLDFSNSMASILFEMFVCVLFAICIVGFLLGGTHTNKNGIYAIPSTCLGHSLICSSTLSHWHKKNDMKNGQHIHVIFAVGFVGGLLSMKEMEWLDYPIMR